jgi:hypothetical protein
MESKISRRNFLKQCAQVGGACCAVMALGPRLGAQTGTEEKKPVDLKQFSYCGLPCFQGCELYKATIENNVEAKKLVYEQWEMKKNHGIDFDPDKVFCYGCKPGDKPENKMLTGDCEVRKCASANEFEACVQCKDLSACGKEFWKKWPQAYEHAKKLQAKYITQPGAALLENKTKI